MIVSPFATYEKLIRKGFKAAEARTIVDQLFARHFTTRQRLNKTAPTVTRRKS